MEENNNEAEVSCNRRKGERSLIREKRKAMALYLRCKHLPSQVMTCPGEKAGMLREALKGLEVVGDSRKIRDCLEMIKSLQGVSLY
jgi:sterol regulatory element-binding transcription factor 1